MRDFDLECIYCTSADTCALGHTSCGLNCLDFESENYDDYLDKKSINNDYQYDGYDWFDEYLDDLNDGLIPPDYEL
jgi:hypothetical protein